MLLRLATLAALAFLATPVAPACACSCAQLPMSYVSLAVRGEVIAIETRDLGEGRRSATATIAVERVVRGPAGLETVRISYPVQDGINCGIGFRVGDEQLFLAHHEAGAYRTSLCLNGRFNEAQLRAPQPRR